MDLEGLKILVSILTTAAATVFATFAISAVLRSGILRLKFGSFQLMTSPAERAEARALIDAVALPRENVPFETEQLAQYYSQVLAHSKISFWFSLIFASLGFVVIIIASFLYSTATIGSTVVQIFAGVIMDAISALFFVQSKNAQTAMGEFFDKLRRDRQQAESRKICELVSDQQAKDALRIQLALHYAEIGKADEIAQAIMQTCLTKRGGNGQNAGSRVTGTVNH